MKLKRNAVKLFLVGGLATAVIGCSGGAGNSTTASTTQPSSGRAAQPTQSHAGHSSQSEAPNEVASVSEDLNQSAARPSASPGGHMHDMAMGMEGMTALRELSGKDWSGLPPADIRV